MALKPQKPVLRWKAAVLYLQGSEAGRVQFSLQCNDIPIGSKVTMTADTPGPVPPIFLAPTVVSTYPTFTTGIMADVPADYKSNIIFELYCDKKAPAGGSVTFIASYPKQPAGNPASAGGPVRMIVVAEVTIAS